MRPRSVPPLDHEVCVPHRGVFGADEGTGGFGKGGGGEVGVAVVQAQGQTVVARAQGVADGDIARGEKFNPLQFAADEVFAALRTVCQTQDGGLLRAVHRVYVVHLRFEQLGDCETAPMRGDSR